MLQEGCAAYDDVGGAFYVVGAAGNTEPSGRGTWPITDGVPALWTNGEPSPLPMGSGNAWGWANSILIGP